MMQKKTIEKRPAMAPRFDDLSDLHCGEKSDNKSHLAPSERS